MGLRTLIGTMPTEHSNLQTKTWDGGSNTPMNSSSPVPKPFNDALSRLPQAQVREVREAFQILDRDSDGQLNRDDVVDMLGSLGMLAIALADSDRFCVINHMLKLVNDKDSIHPAHLWHPSFRLRDLRHSLYPPTYRPFRIYSLLCRPHPNF